ncbi:MAG TPA: maleylpyruvate isomerase N-terminal domain-containing protein [Trebonia sp.]|nr:maleylpyruvate isomerase N-terminal domain-containing protein [Trebonia sp.]
MGERLPQGIREIAARQVERVAEVVAGLSDADLVAPTLCDGWLAAHLLVHMRLGLVEHATSFAEPAGPEDGTDRDYVSYWRDWPPGNRPASYASARFHWANGSAYATADSLREHFAGTCRQAAGLSRQAATGNFRFQGHVMAAGDILAMWTVEWVIHQLDLTARLPGGRLAPTDESMVLAVRTVDELTGSPVRPPAWDEATYVLKATGRFPLDAEEQALLGDRAKAFPAFG